MKRFLIVMLIALVAATAVFANGFRMGVDQSVLMTSVALSYDFGRWAEVGGNVGVSLLAGIGECSESFQEGTDEWYTSLAKLGTLTRAEIFADAKLVDTPHFDFRVGARGAVQGIMSETDDYLFFFMAGPKAEMSYKFNDNCRIYLNGFYPVVGNGLGDSSVGTAILGVFSMLDQFVHLGVSWAL